MKSQAKQQVNEAITLLSQIQNDTSVPRNIRRSALQCMEILGDEKSDKSLSLRAATSIEILEESTQDPNCPFHIRTKMYYVLTKLELPEEEFDH